MWDGPGDANLGDLERVWIYFFQRIAKGNGNAAAAGGGPMTRTFLVKDTTVRTSACDDVPVHPGGEILTVIGVLKKAITADLTVTLNVVTASSSTEVGSFTLPAATPLKTAVQFSDLAVTEFEDLDVLSWDITASDGSGDDLGVATFTIYWAPS